MVESYSKNANHNMRRPVVKEEIVDLMRQRQKQVTGSLKELEDFARKENIPIIPHETVAYFRFLMETIQPKNILEIGTAIGFQPSWWQTMLQRPRLQPLTAIQRWLVLPRKILPSLTVASKLHS